MSLENHERGDGASDALLEMIQGSWKSQAIRVAASLGIADELAGGPRDAAAVASNVGADAGAVERLLRALATIGVVRAAPGGCYELTSIGERLRRDHPETLRAWSLWWGEHLWPVWGHLEYSIRTGKSARADLLGTTGFEHLQRDAETRSVFHNAMAELSRMSGPALVRAGDFARFGHVVDVGGGNGEFLALILNANPAARGTLFEQASAIDDDLYLRASVGCAGRLRVEAGDFFDRVPEGGDAYVLKSVIHDWSDADALRLLAVVRRAMRPGASLLVFEQAMPDVPGTSCEDQSVARSDLNMLAAHGARERTVSELSRLLRESGFAVERSFVAGMTFTLVEGRAV